MPFDFVTGLSKRLGQSAMTNLGIFGRRRLYGILFGLDHEPPLIAIVGKLLEHSFKIERAVARHREGALYDRVKKTLSGAVKLVDHIHAHILGVNMRDAIVVLVDDAHDIAARKSNVAGV